MLATRLPSSSRSQRNTSTPRSCPHVHEETEDPAQDRQALGRGGCRARDGSTLPDGRRTPRRGQGPARRGTASVARRLEDAQRSPRPGGAVERIECGTSARADPDPLRAHGGVALRLLSRLGGTDGRRPGHHAQLRAARAGLRRRAPDEFRRLRHARAQHRLRHQRPGRDAAGALRMGPQAPGRQHRDRIAAPGAARQRRGARGHRRGARVPRTHDRLRVDARTRCLVRQDRHAALRGPLRRPRGDEGGATSASSNVCSPRSARRCPTTSIRSWCPRKGHSRASRTSRRCSFTRAPSWRRA